MPSKKSHVQLYADECFPIASVLYLKSQGFSILHAFDKKFIRKSDRFHLRCAKRLNRVLITLDRDFMYYEQATLKSSPGVIVISTGSAIPTSINYICLKLLKMINDEYFKESLVKATRDKVVKTKNGQRSEKNY